MSLPGPADPGSPAAPRRPASATSTGWAALAAAFWALLCLRWFDPGAAFRPAWLAALPPSLLAVATAAAVGLSLRRRPAWPAWVRDREALLVVALAALFRLPLAWQGAAAFVTADGALSGLVALRLREGLEYLVFVPAVPYSGSLKSHLAAAVSWLGMDLARAFALASVAFYAAFVAGVHRLGRELEREGGPRGLATAAGLYLAFAPPFVTRYSLSNDGNYVEVLALGTWALVLAVACARRGAAAPDLCRAALAGVCLGLAFWCHLLAVIHLAAVGLLLALAAFVDGSRALASRLRVVLALAAAVAAGWGVGAFPALIWNAANGGESFRYLLPTGTKVGHLESGPPLAGRAALAATDLVPVLFGHDPGFPGLLDALLQLFGAAVGLCCAVALAAAAMRAVRDPKAVALRTAVVFALVNLAVALLALPHVPRNPRYLLFLMSVAPLLLAWAFFAVPLGRLGFAAIVAVGAVVSAAQGPEAVRADAQWRDFVRELRRAGIDRCYTDFFLSTKVNLLSEEAVVCSSELGPSTTEYFRDYRDRLREAPAAALVAVNRTAAEKLERRLTRLGVVYERRDLMKPVLLPRRKVEPGELFPGLARPEP